MKNTINVSFTKTELKTLITLLRMANREFSNNGCNDFNVLDIDLPIEAAHELRSQISDYSTEDLESLKTSPYLCDFMLFSLFEKKLTEVL